MASSQPDSSRIRQAAELLMAEATHIEQRFNESYPTMIQEGRIMPLCRMSARIQLLRTLAQQIESI